MDARRTWLLIFLVAMAMIVPLPRDTAESRSAPPGSNPGEQTSHKEAGSHQTGVIHAAAISGSAEFRPWKFIILHHSAGKSGDVAAIDREHRSRRDANGLPWRGIGYHFVIGNGQGMRDGEIQSTFRWEEQSAGAHAGQAIYNQYGIGICLIGNFEESSPTAAQRESTRELLRTLQERFQISDEQVVRHGDLKATACPGKLFSLKSIKAGGEEAPVADGITARK